MTWHTEKQNVEVDDIVLIADNNAIHGKWTIGRVIEVYPHSWNRWLSWKRQSENSSRRAQPLSHQDCCYMSF